MRNMRRLCVITALSVVAFTGLARADATGELWINVGNANSSTFASTATVAAQGAPTSTFSAPSSPLRFCSNGTVAECGAGPIDITYTVAGFLASGGATAITNPGMLTGQLSNTGNNTGTLFEFTGTVSVTNGEMFTVSHDDGLTLIIDGVTVINQPGPTSPTITTATYSGPTGNESYTLVYGECCSSPAVLNVNLPFQEGVPGPVAGAGLPGLVFGFGGLLAAWRFRRKQAAA
jgi:hypothetical protein